MVKQKRYYCHVCGYDIAWHRRGPHVRGKDHQRVLRTEYADAVRKAADLQKDSDYIRIDVGHQVMTLSTGRMFRVTVVALDSLGHRTVVLRSNGGFRQYLHGEVTSVQSVREIGCVHGIV